MKKYQLFFNKYYGFRRDYKASFWYYINQWIERYLFRFWRDKHKDSDSFKFEFFSWLWIAFFIRFSWSKYVYWSFKLDFAIKRPNWRIALKLDNNTA